MGAPAPHARSKSACSLAKKPLRLVFWLLLAPALAEVAAARAGEEEMSGRRLQGGTYAWARTGVSLRARSAA